MKINKLMFRLFIALIWTIFIFLFLYIFLVNETFIPNNSYFQNTVDSKKNICIDDKKASYSVVINGYKYPNFIPLYENKSIDFQCLNSSQNKKIILVWTKFKGEPLPLSDYMKNH